jgi:hypothetical protein
MHFTPSLLITRSRLVAVLSELLGDLGINLRVLLGLAKLPACLLLLLVVRGAVGLPPLLETTHSALAGLMAR